MKIYFHDHVKTSTKYMQAAMKKQLSQRADFILMSVHPLIKIVSFP
jgi:hypothetical protein